MSAELYGEDEVMISACHSQITSHNLPLSLKTDEKEWTFKCNRKLEAHFHSKEGVFSSWFCCFSLSLPPLPTNFVVRSIAKWGLCKLEIICAMEFLDIWQFSHLFIMLFYHILLASGFYEYVWWSSVVTSIYLYIYFFKYLFLKLLHISPFLPHWPLLAFPCPPLPCRGWEM